MTPDGTAPPDADALLARLRAFEGRPSGPPTEARDEVNQAMIRHWVDAMGDDNPVYVDEESARANGFPGVVAPPTMLQAWIMRGYRSQPGGSWQALREASGELSAQEQLSAVLNEAGFTSVVATNCDQEYLRPVVLGDRLTVRSVIDSVSPEKHTGLGDGHFVTTRLEFTDQVGEPVATMRFRILRFRPQPTRPKAEAPLRPRPAITPDIAFFFDGARHGVLLIQRCAACGVLRHPPRPACASCGSFAWDTVTASGRGTVYSFVVVHHPQVGGFDYPLPIAVVELEEGTRLVADLIDVAPAQVHIGMPVVAELVAVDDELVIPMFRPARVFRGGGLMDFDFTEEQLAVSEAAGTIFEGMAGADRVAEIENSEDRFDAALWSELAKANLLGLGVPEAHGGSGLGLTELCLVLEQQGRAVAPVPLWATLVLGALPLARYGTPEQQVRWLPAVAAGDVVLSAALSEVAGSRHNHPTVRVEPDGEGWRLYGTAFAVPQAHLAARVLVPAAVDGDGDAGTIVVLVDPAAPGATLERATTTDHQIHPHLHMDGVSVGAADVVAGPTEGAAAVAWMLDRARTGLCAVQLGVTEEAVRRAAAYLNQRHQFGRPLSSFQGTMLRAADAYIDTEAIRVTTWQAAWRIDQRLPASEAVAVAHWWASEAGQRVVHATQHLHGGLGADISYPIHRYFLWGKQIELMLQGPSAELARLGAMVATRLRTSSVAGTVAAVEGP